MTNVNIDIVKQKRDAILTGKIICEIINPCDPYTLRTNDFLIASIAILILGEGKLGLRYEGENTPILFGWDEWLSQKGVDNVASFVKEHKEDIANCLESILIGTYKDREDAENTLKFIKDEHLITWLEERHNRKLSSMTDIGSLAWELAEKIRNANFLKKVKFKLKMRKVVEDDAISINDVDTDDWFLFISDIDVYQLVRMEIKNDYYFGFVPINRPAGAGAEYITKSLKETLSKAIEDKHDVYRFTTYGEALQWLYDHRVSIRLGR